MKYIVLIMIFILTNANAQEKAQQQSGVVHNTSPVGSIIISILDYKTFSELNPNTFQNYVLCDGRTIDENSTYYKVGKIKTAPDLRGLFMRGVNKMDENETEENVVSKIQMNPDNKIAGHFQPESFKSHNHEGSYRYIQPHNTGGSSHGNLMMWGGQGSQNFKLHDDGGKETRPKNMSVYYYLKIN